MELNLRIATHVLKKHICVNRRAMQTSSISVYEFSLCGLIGAIHDLADNTLMVASSTPLPSSVL